MASEATIFGIPNCDTVKKARHWLEANGIPYRFHDFRKDGLDRATLEGWADELGWERLLNRSGTTFRALTDEAKRDLDRGRAIELMLAQPTLIRRPVLDLGSRRLCGFKPELYAEAAAGR